VLELKRRTRRQSWHRHRRAPQCGHPRRWARIPRFPRRRRPRPTPGSPSRSRFSPI